MIEILTAVMAAGDSRDFHINGERFEILDCQYPIDVLLMDKSGAQQSTMKNAEASFFAQPKEGFQTIKITSQQAQVVRMFVGSGDAGTRRISSTVSVIDGERARVNAGAVFAGTPAINPGASLVGQVQVWNPVGSGRNVVIAQAGVGMQSASSVNAYFFAAAFVTDQSATRLANKKAGAAAGVAQVRVGTAAAAPSNPFWSAFCAANGYIPWPMKGVLIVPPGFGFGFVADAPAAVINSNIEWFEEAI